LTLNGHAESCGIACGIANCFATIVFIAFESKSRLIAATAATTTDKR